MDIRLMEERPPYVRFEYRAIEDRAESIKTGKYTTKNVAFALVTPSGTKDIVEREAESWLTNMENLSHQGAANPQWVTHFKHAFEQWKIGEEIPENGTPIKGWVVISPAEQTNIISAGVRTVEDLAAANEQALNNIGMGARSLKDKAIKWLESAKDTGKVVQEVTALRQENDDLKRTLQDMMERMQALESDKPRRGRPPKEDAA